MTEANDVFKQAQQLSKAIVETNKALNALFDSSTFKQIYRMQEYLQCLHESIVPTLKVVQKFAKQQTRIIESIKPIIETTQFYSTQLNALISIVKINYPTFEITKIIQQHRKFVHINLKKELKKQNNEWYKMWLGSWKAINSDNPDKIRQSTHSMRELFRTILHHYSDEEQIMRKYSLEKKGDITRKLRLHFILGNKVKKKDIDKLDEIISSALKIDDKMHKAAHLGGREEKIKQLLWLYEGYVWYILQEVRQN